MTTPDKPRALGRLVEHDPASRRFQAPRAAGPLRRVLWKRSGGPFDQGYLGSCTGNAVAGCLNTDPLHVKYHRLLREADALKVYSLATQLDDFPGQYPPDDTGSSGLAACKAAQQLGLITSYRHAFGIDHALEALQFGPVITGVNWYEGFDQPDSKAVVRIGGQIRGGHEFCVVGYDPTSHLLTCWNSWGRGYGRGGRFYMTDQTWGQLLDEEGDVTVPVKNRLDLP